jgi:hypothetical protein
MFVIIIILIVFLIFLFWKIFNKKNNSNKKDPNEISVSYILHQNGRAINSYEVAKLSDSEVVDLTDVFDGCGKDMTHSVKLLTQMYGPSIHEKVLLYNNDDNLLYSNKWTSFNVCKGLDQDDIVRYGYGEVVYK